MTKLKDSEIKGIKNKGYRKESLGRGNGAIEFRRVNKTIPVYYFYWRGKTAVYIKLDNYKLTPKTPGKTLAQLRDQALEMVALKKQVAPQDLKGYLQDKEIERLQQREEKRLKQEQEARKGTFHNLMECYADSLKARHRERGTVQTFDVMSNFKTFVIKPFPDLVKKKAAEVQPMDLSPVFAAIIERNKPGMYNQVRRYLSACFNYGIKADYMPREALKNGKLFDIRFNPVTPYPLEPRKARLRELSHKELRWLWRDIELGVFADLEQYGLFVKFCFACFGNRPKQLMRLKWSDIDFDERTLSFIDYKGKGEPRTTIIPLTDLSMQILRKVRQLPDYPSFAAGDQAVKARDSYVFTTKRGTKLNYAVLERIIREHNKSIQLFNIRDAEAKGIEYEPKERWTMKDFRRTATSILTRARIIKEHRYLLQSRTDGSIESKHYDVSDRMDEKREAAEKYEAVLNEILKDRELPDKAPIDSFEGFREMVLDSGELRHITDYVREGYKKGDVRQWIRKMLSAGEVEMYGRVYVLKGFNDQNEKRLMDKRRKSKEYKAFRKEMLNSDDPKLPTQWDYAKGKPVSRKMVGYWYKIMQDEGIVEKVGRRYHLKQPGDTYESTPDQARVSDGLHLQVPG